MTRGSSSSAVIGHRKDPVVAGLDLLTTSERDADRIAHALCAALAGRGATEVTVATHWAQVGELRHVALTVESSAVQPAALWEVLAAASGPHPADPAPEPAREGRLLGDQYTGPPELRPSLDAAVDAHLTRGSGRVVVFTGCEGLVGTLTVGEILSTSAIDRVNVLASSAADRQTLLVTRDFVRARWTGGELVLDTQPAAGGTLVPFETPFPTPCCAYHS